MQRVEELYRASPAPENFARSYFDNVSKILGKMEVGSIARFIEIILAARETGATIYIMGNGGSAATASHFANDLSHGTLRWRKPLRTICLSDNIPRLTAVANDHGYDNVFLLPLQAQMNKGDVVIGISTSGNSPNVLRAMEFARDKGIAIGITGLDGGALKELAHHCIHVPSNPGEHGVIEDLHMILSHLTSAYLKHYVAQES